MKFCDFQYIRPDFQIIKNKYLNLIDNFNKSKTLEQEINIINEINEINKHVDTMYQLAKIRNSINSTDIFYEKENEYMDEYLPLFNSLRVIFYKSLLNSKFIEQLKSEFSPQIFNIAQLEIRCFSDEIILDLQEENKLVTNYLKLISSAKINYEGKELNLSQLNNYMESNDRNVRKYASEKLSSFFQLNEERFDDIFDKLVKVRNNIAKKLKFNNFIELGYLRKHRSDYNFEDVKRFRELILKYIVPLSNELRNKQADLIGVENLKYYDLSMHFKTGNPKPKGNTEILLDKAKRMYGELSSETNDFFNLMLEKNLFDLETKSNKHAGAYCTFLHDYESPFIFANFNNNLRDVNILTHEAGHAFQSYNSRFYDFPEYIFPTSEIDEVHSMSMEFITWPWMELFFEEEVDKFKYLHLTDSILFIPYGATVDEFQHIVYENPEMTPNERKKVWRDIERKYTPYKDYKDNEFLDKGTYWYKQDHIFFEPFYYIDYVLAQICAYQYFIKFNDNKEKAWNDYMNLSMAGGSKSFNELLNIGSLQSPFNENTIKSVISYVKRSLDLFNNIL